MLLLDLANCGPSGLLRVIYFFKLIMNIIFILIPIALIVLISIDISKAVISGDEDKQRKSFSLGLKRILYAVIVFFVPTIVSLVNEVLGDLGVDYSVCYNEITIEAIDYLESVEYSCEQAEKYVYIAERVLSEDSFEEAQKYIDEALDKEIKLQLQDRLDAAEKYAKEHPKQGNADMDYDGISSTGDCKPGSGIKVVSSEPDPSCAINYWSSKINKNDFIYPSKDGQKLGAWPKNFSSIPANVNIKKTYNNGTLIWPTTPSNGKYRFVYQHNGIDIMADIGTPIYAPADGILLYSEWGHTVNKGSDETAYTATIIMDNPIVQDGVKHDTIFMTHMSGIVNRCAENQCNKNVVKGELIGFVGTAAGSASSGGYAPHLHITIYPRGQYSKGLNTTKIQKLYNLTCGTSCSNISIKAGE